MDPDDLTDTERFEIRRKLGEGGMGVVYEAYDRERHGVVALKTVRNVHGGALGRFKQEFRALQRLEHPNLVALGELITEGHRVFFTMELVPGVSLLEYVRREPPGSTRDGVTPSEDTLRADRAGPVMAAAPRYDEPRLRACLAQLAAALAALHAAGIVHRDVKPSNALVTAAGRLVLVDLGLALDTTPSVNRSTDRDVVGTVAYMAPEQAHSGQVGPAADWYSLGVVLYEALTGTLPHGGATALELLMNKQRSAPPPPRVHASHVPRDLDQLCQQLLAVEPAERPSDVEVLDRLGVPAADRPDAAAAVAPAERTVDAPFVGRDAEVTRLAAAFDEVRAGATRVFHIEGESGIGKTMLLHRLAAPLEDRGDALVLWGRCHEREQVPYKAFDGVVDSLARHLRSFPDDVLADMVPGDAGLLPRLFPALERVAPLARAPRPPTTHIDPQQLRTRAFAALRAVLTWLGARTPLVLIVDDIQWTDADSLVLLGDLLRPPDPPRVLALLAARPESDGGAGWRAPLTAALEGTPMVTVALAPLGAEVGTELARTLLGPGRDDDAAAVARDAAGHPLFIAELCRHVVAGRGERPRQLEEVIGARVAALPDGTRRLLELVCLADTPLPPSVLGAAADSPAADLARHLSRLGLASLIRTAGLAGNDRVAPYHARVAGAVLAGLDHHARRAGHVALAAALSGSTLARDAPELLLLHLAAAGDAAGAARHAEIAADRAMAGLAFDRAAALYREALRLGEPTGEARRALELHLAAALADAGRGPEAAEVYLRAADGADPATRLDCRRHAAEQWIVTGHLDAGQQALEQLLGEIGVRWAPTPRKVLAALLWQRLRLRLRGLGGNFRHASEIAERELRRIDVFRAAGLGFGFIDPTRGAVFNARYLRAALDAGERSRVVPALSAEAIFQATQGGRGCRRARVLLDRLRQITEGMDDPYYRGWIEGVEGVACYFENDFAAAVPLLGESAEHFREAAGSTWERNSIHMLHMLALRYLGDLVALRELHDYCVRDASRRGDRFLETTARRHGGVLWLAADDPAGAEDNLRAASWTPPAGKMHLQHWYELETRAELALYTGGTIDVVAPLARFFGSLLPRVQSVRVAARWLDLRVHITRDPARARAALRALRREPVRTAHVFTALGQAALAPTDQARATHLRAAVELADAAHMALHAAASRRRLGTLLGGDQGATLIADADAALRARSVADPARMAAMIAPGAA